ncbi:MAG: hypothetical protein GWN77_06595, partial [Gammaproteobacteria bacterium]|nr:hypothetical protein [Gammaproteobacteria bacterium]
EGKIRRFQKEMAANPPAPVAATVKWGESVVEATLRDLDTMIASKDKYDRRSINMLDKLVKRVRGEGQHLQKIRELVKDPDPATAGGAVMGLVDDVKRRIDKVVKKHYRSPDLASEVITDELEDMADRIRFDLEDPTMWGEGAAAKQIADNRAWKADLTLSRSRNAWLNESIGTLPGNFREVKRASYK